MALGVAMIAWLPHLADHVSDIVRRQPVAWYVLVGMLGLWVLRRCLTAMFDPEPGNVRRAVALGVLYIVTLDALACYAVAGYFWATMILLLLVPAMLLGRWINPT